MKAHILVAEKNNHSKNRVVTVELSKIIETAEETATIEKEISENIGVEIELLSCRYENA